MIRIIRYVPQSYALFPNEASPRQTKVQIAESSRSIPTWGAGKKPSGADTLYRQFLTFTRYLPNNSPGNLKSLPRKAEIDRKVEIKLRKNEMKVPRNLPIAPWRISISPWESSIWAHLSTYNIQNSINWWEEASNDRCWTFALLWYTTDYRLFGIAVLRITLYLCTV